MSFSVNVESYPELLGMLPAVMEWNGVDSAVYHYGDYEWIPSGTTGWVTFNQEFTLTESDATTLKVIFYYYPQGSPKAAGYLFMDDISLESTNLLSNGGFEDAATSPWNTANGGTVAVSTTVFSGSQSAKFDFPAADNAWINQQFSISPADAAKTYILSFTVNTEAHPELLGILPVVGEWGAANGWTWHNGDYKWIQANTAGWVTYSQEIDLTDSEASSLWVGFKFYPQGSPTKVAGSVLLDAISLVEAP